MIEQETINSLWLLDELDDPFIMFPVQDVIRAISQTYLESTERLVDLMGPWGVARKFWSVEAEHHHDKIGVLIGTTFVLNQVIISQTVAIVKKLRQQVPNLSSLPKQKYEILKLDAEIDPRSGLSEMVIVDAVANYFKHHHEWPDDWIEPAKESVQSHSIQLVKRIGMSPEGRTENLYSALHSLTATPSDMGQITYKIEAWRYRLNRRLYKMLGIPDRNDAQF